MSKKEISIPLIKVENIAATNLRRANYALQRDEKNSEINDAIAARLLADKKTKCEKCGREFATKYSDEVLPLCPDCRGKE